METSKHNCCIQEGGSERRNPRRNRLYMYGGGGRGGIGGFTFFVIGEILVFVMREFNFSVTCDGSISREA